MTKILRSSELSYKHFHRKFVKIHFRAHAVEEALRKDRDCPAEKETPKKEKGGGKRPRRFAAPSTWPRNVLEFAAQKFTRVRQDFDQNLPEFSRNLPNFAI